MYNNFTHAQNSCRERSCLYSCHYHKFFSECIICVCAELWYTEKKYLKFYHFCVKINFFISPDKFSSIFFSQYTCSFIIPVYKFHTDYTILYDMLRKKCLKIYLWDKRLFYKNKYYITQMNFSVFSLLIYTYILYCISIEFKNTAVFYKEYKIYSL